MRSIVLVGLLALPAVATAQVRLPKGQEEVNRASERMARGDYAGAEPLLRRAVVDAPNDPYAHFNLASVLRATGRNDEAITEYHAAKRLFEDIGPRANGEGDVGNCLYGIALAEEAKGDPVMAERAWQSYVRFARRFEREQPAVAIAQERIRTNAELARARGTVPGTREATRPSVTR